MKLGAVRAPLAPVAGVYLAGHPQWGDRVTLNPDGSYRRSNGDGGRWTLEGRTLTLHWTIWGPERLEWAGDGLFANSGGFRLRRL